MKPLEPSGYSVHYRIYPSKIRPVFVVWLQTQTAIISVDNIKFVLSRFYEVKKKKYLMVIVRPSVHPSVCPSVCLSV